MNALKISQGMSGCFVEITCNHTILKHSPAENYNIRLLAQSKKQHLFSRMSFRNIYVPKVIRFGEIEKRLYFEMEYVSGLGALDFIEQANKKDLEFVCDTFFSYFNQIKEHSKKINAKNIVLKKIKDLSKKSRYANFINFILNLTDKQKSIFIPNTICHGDLTFANMIFEKNKIFILDFLDSYLNTFLCDLAKIKQDLFYFWLPSLNDDASNLRAIQSMEFMWRKIENEFKKDMQSLEFKIIDVLNILRIEPYINNEKQAKILEFALKKTELYEDFSDSYGGKII